MCQLKIFSVIAIVVLTLGQLDAKPYQHPPRIKRTSDQRLAELETLIALSKMNGKLVTIPIGFGKIDPNKIGRRKRSVSLLLQQLINDLSVEDNLSKEVFQSSQPKEEDGGEEKEQEGQQDLEDILLNEKRQLMRKRHLPIALE